MTNKRDLARDDDGVDEAGMQSFPASDSPPWTGGRRLPEADAEPEANDEKMYTSEPLEDDDGNSYVIRQQDVGPGNEAGSV